MKFKKAVYFWLVFSLLLSNTIVHVKGGDTVNLFKRGVETAYTYFTNQTKSIGTFDKVNPQMEKIKRMIIPLAEEIHKEYFKLSKPFDEKITKELIPILLTSQSAFRDLNFQFLKALSVLKQFSTNSSIDVQNIENILLKHADLVKNEYKNLDENNENFKNIKSQYLVIKFLSEIFRSIDMDITAYEKSVLSDDELFSAAVKKLPVSQQISNIGATQWGQAIQTMMPKLWTKLQQVGIASLDATKAEDKIFPTGIPLPSEVKQGLFSDCHLMSVLITLANNNPSAIKDCFVQEDIENRDDIKIRFFNVDVKTLLENEQIDYVFPSSPIIITVSKKTVLSVGAQGKKALWPKLIEKAYARYKTKMQIAAEDIFFLGNEALNLDLVDNSCLPMLAITGKKTKAYKFPEKVEDLSKYNSTVNAIYQKIEKKLSKKLAVVGICLKEKTITDGLTKKSIKLIPNHAYAVLEVLEDSGKKYIKLREPSKILGNKGVFTIELDDFAEYFPEVDVQTSKTK
jgi:hypothetical protein